jgi:hypothetical protein
MATRSARAIMSGAPDRRAAGRGRRRDRGAAVRSRPCRPPAADDEVGVPGQPVQLCAHRLAQSPGHAVADHRVADGLADHETGPGTGRRPLFAHGATARLLGPFGEVVEHHGRPPGAPAGPDDRGELRTPAQACLRGQHVRRRASRDPCADDRRGSPGPRGCASAAGSRGSWTVGGCSAGTCACSRGTPTTRHRRCAPAGGRAHAGRRTATCRTPATPEAATAERNTRSPSAQPNCTDGEGRPEPSTDSTQHNRGRAGAGGRAHRDHPWSTREAPDRRRHAGADAPARVSVSLPGCG